MIPEDGYVIRKIVEDIEEVARLEAVCGRDSSESLDRLYKKLEDRITLATRREA